MLEDVRRFDVRMCRRLSSVTRGFKQGVTVGRYIWQMELNPNKSKVLSIGNNQFNFGFMLKVGIIQRVSSDKDIAVTVQSNLKFTIHCTEIVKKGYFVIRTILNSFRQHDSVFYSKDVCHLCSSSLRILLISVVSSSKAEKR